jgi:hypothetical protein
MEPLLKIERNNLGLSLALRDPGGLIVHVRLRRSRVR